jgi:hypothetical protein
MKKLLFCVIMFAASSGYAQTKEETIAWLKEKMGDAAKHWDSDYQIDWISINECEMEIQYTIAKGYPEEVAYKETIPMNNWQINNSNELSLPFDGIKWIEIDPDASNHTLSSFGANEESLDDPYFVSKSDIRILLTEPNLHKRIIKAVNHLSTFCKEK